MKVLPKGIAGLDVFCCLLFRKCLDCYRQQMLVCLKWQGAKQMPAVHARLYLLCAVLCCAVLSVMGTSITVMLCTLLLVLISNIHSCL